MCLIFFPLSFFSWRGGREWLQAKLDELCVLLFLFFYIYILQIAAIGERRECG